MRTAVLLAAVMASACGAQEAASGAAREKGSTSSVAATDTALTHSPGYRVLSFDRLTTNLVVRDEQTGQHLTLACLSWQLNNDMPPVASNTATGVCNNLEGELLRPTATRPLPNQRQPTYTIGHENVEINDGRNTTVLENVTVLRVYRYESVTAYYVVEPARK